MKTLKSYAHLFHKSLACLLAFCMVNLPVWALNAGDVISSQNATLNGGAPANTVAFDIAGKGIINWSDLSVEMADAVNTLKFNGADGFAVLNRVNSMVNFNGILNAPGGRVYMVSPNGVRIGGDAQITAKAFTAAGLNIADTDFLAGIDKFQPFAGGVVGDVTNSAIITNVTDQVSFLGKTVLNEGTIVLPSGGVAVMAAGEKVYLGEPGGKVIVEMTGIEDGQVTNSAAGTIDAPNGKIVLAAGDIYSTPLHPHFQVGDIPDGDLDYTDPADKAIIDAQPVIAETGMGTVTQEGAIGADGASGEVVLTAGDDVVLASGGETSAVGGKVTAFANDFGNFDSQTLFNEDATIYVGDGEAHVYGNELLYAGDVVADDGATVYLGAQDLTIADVLPAGGPALNTVYEEMVEYYSNQGINLDLAGDDQVTVEYMADGEILGGSGDITLRNVFDNGGITFLANGMEQRTELHTIAQSDSIHSGSIYMTSGSGGILAGDLRTDTQPQYKGSEPGEILLQSTNGGDIVVGNMEALNAKSTQVSAVASGDLTVNGNAISENKVVDDDNQSVLKAILCLIAEQGDVTLNGQEYAVYSHGKQKTTADVRIAAGGDVLVGSASQPAVIAAEAKTSQQNQATISTASIVVKAGTAQDEPGTIIINGVSYAPGQAYLSNNQLYAKAWPGPLAVSSSSAPTSTSGTETTWQQTGTPAENFFVKIAVDNSAETGCVGCPTPPGLPPVPHIFWLVNDELETNWRSGNVSGFDPAEVDVLANDSGIKFDPTTSIVNYSITTAKGGTLTVAQYEDAGTGKLYWAFSYTPPTDQPFVWDGTSEYATFTDTFEYQATKVINGDTVLSKNTATVNIAVTNFLPTLADGTTQTIHMSTGENPTSADFDVSTLIVDSDGTPGTISYGKVEGWIPLNDDSIIATDDARLAPYYVGGAPVEIDGSTVTYNPLDGYVNSEGEKTTFGYSVTDSSIIQNSTAVEIKNTDGLSVIVENERPTGDVWLGTTDMDTSITDGTIQGGSFDDDGDTILNINVVGSSSNDYNHGYGGSLSYDGTDFDYDPSTMGLPGYTGDTVDDWNYDISSNADDRFDVELWDGEYSYTLEQVAQFGEFQPMNGSSALLTRSEETGSGTVSVDIVNDAASGDAWYGQVHMNDGGTKQELAVDFADDVTVQNGTYDGTINSGADQGGKLAYDGTEWTYSTDGVPTGYTGDASDEFGQDGYNADVLFTVDISNGEYDYWFGEGPAPEGYEFYGPAEIYRKAVTSEGTVSVDITNQGPAASTEGKTVHMGTDIAKIGLAQDTPDTVNGTVTPGITDAITVNLVGDDGDGIIETAKGTITLIDNGDGTFSFAYDAKEGATGTDVFTYTVSDGEIGADPATGTITIDLTNMGPSATVEDKTVHMGTDIATIGLAKDTPDTVDGTINPGITDTIIVKLVGDDGDGKIETVKGTLSLIDNGDGTFSFAYDAKDGAAGTDVFTYTVSDGQIGAAPATGTITIVLTNAGPAANNDSSSTQKGVPVTITILANDDDVFDTVNGTANPGFKDLPLSIISISNVVGGTAILNADGTVTFIPDPDFTGTASFEYTLTDGGVNYSGQVPVPYTDGATVKINIAGDTPEIPVAPLADLRVPELKGCPALMDAAATELAINTDDLQMLISNSLASNPNLQPCDACEQLLNASAILKDPDGQRMAALLQVFSTIAPADAPFTPELSASVATAFADMRDSDPQYAMANDYVEAFVTYVAAVERDLKVPVGDPVALVLEKYGQGVTGSDNPNISAYVTAQLTAGGNL